MVEKAEVQKQQDTTRKANNKASLAEAKKHGREAYEAEKARIAQENMVIDEARKQERLQQVAAKQLEKAQKAEARKVRTSSAYIYYSWYLPC